MIMTDKTKMITHDKESSVLLRLAGPMLFGILGIVIFNLMDTLFVGRLGTIELAALSFTFPVVLVINSVALGLGMGMMAVVSKAAGRNDREELKKLISWGLFLSLIIVAVVAVAGLLTIDPVFRALGADEQTLPVIKKYMRIWYIGTVFVVIPMVGNSAIRGLGDIRTPSIVMLIAASINTGLDPLLIFGIGPFPELGVSGAALATVFARFITFSVTIWVLVRREKIISFANSTFSNVKAVWKQILLIGVPNALTKMIIPFGTAFITSLIATHGREAVAGYGVAGKLEMFILMPLMALTSIIPVFIGQNLGAGKKDRVLKGLKISVVFSVVYGIAIYIVLIFSGSFLGSLFNKEQAVIDIVALYLIIVPAAYLFRNMMDLSVISLAVTGKPVHSAFISLIQMFAIYIPLAAAGSRLLGVPGIFSALAVSFLLAGPSALLITRKHLNNMPNPISKK